MATIDLTLTPEGIRDAARLAVALLDGDAVPLEELVMAATADPGRLLAGALMLARTPTPGDTARDTGLVVHERAALAIEAVSRSRARRDGSPE